MVMMQNTKALQKTYSCVYLQILKARYWRIILMACI